MNRFIHIAYTFNTNVATNTSNAAMCFLQTDTVAIRWCNTNVLLSGLNNVSAVVNTPSVNVNISCSNVVQCYSNACSNRNCFWPGVAFVVAIVLLLLQYARLKRIFCVIFHLGLVLFRSRINTKCTKTQLKRNNTCIYLRAGVVVVAFLFFFGIDKKRKSIEKNGNR